MANEFIIRKGFKSKEDSQITGSISLSGSFKDQESSSGTAGQVLSSTVSGSQWVDAADSGAITGTGTTGTLTKWTTGGSVIGNSIIQDNGSAVTVGGDATFTPSGGSVVVGSNGFITSTQLLDSATAGGRFIGSSSRGVLGDIRIEQTTTGADGGYIRFMTSPNGLTSPTEKMRISSGGTINLNVMSTIDVEGYVKMGRSDGNISRFNQIKNKVYY